MRLNTFGRVYVARDGGEEVALQPRPLAVLAYLAVGGPRDRDHLANLFWPSSKNGLNSLSTTLNRIRAEIPDVVWVRGNTLVGVDLGSDVVDLRDAIDSGDSESAAGQYGGAFLGSLKLRGQSLEFEEWLLEERARLAALVEMALLQRGRDLFEAGEHRAAAVAAEQAWEIAIRDGFPSSDYFETYHLILASAARPSVNAVRSMADDLGIVLAPVEPAEFGTTTPASAVAAVDHRASSGATPLFGCQEELEAIATSVASQRLTTVVGLGGSGKTRLAGEFFNSTGAQDRFAHRYWVNLRAVGDPELVAPAIATALGQRFDTVAALAESLPDDESVLLVLDNFEHVLDSAGIAAELGEQNETLRILVTSRVPLEVATESLVQLDGLDVTDQDAADTGGDSPAEQLFMSSARRAGVGDDRLNGPSRAAIRTICHRVGGNPLALEIAGGWALVLPPAEILDVLSVDNELLGTPMIGDLRSMQAVLNQSWSTLDEPEQRTLMLLASFPAGCLTNEALKLRELPITSIGRLVQHSLARLQLDGRITLHPLIAGHALSELDQRPELRLEFQRVMSRWCQHYSAAIQSDAESTQALEPEIANFTAAWLSDAQHGSWQLHESTLEPLRRFFTESGRVSEGRSLLSAVTEVLRGDANRPEGLLAEILEALGWFEMLSGEVPRARGLLDEALALNHGGRPHTQAQLLRTYGALQLTTGEIEEATAKFNAGLALITDEPGALAASLQYDLAQAHHYQGERDKARSAARLALRAGRSSNNWMVMGRSYLLLADIEVASDPQRAVVLLKEGWAIAQQASLDHLAIYFPHVLGLAHLQLGEGPQAEQNFTDGMDAANAVGQLATVCANYVGRAEARMLSGQTAAAIDDLKTAIRLALKTGSGRYLMWAAVVSCRASAAYAPRPQTLELLTLALRHPAADQDARDKAAQIWRDLFGDTPEPEHAAASSDDAGLDEPAERSLELLNLAEAQIEPLSR